ncbi:MAG: LemA family protein [Candidatus Aenigmatarchaeota archaeon]
MEMNLEIILGIVITLIIISIVIWFVTIYNSLIRLRNNINKAWSNIDVILKQRNDELPKLLETCKGYMKYEKELLEKLTELRTRWNLSNTLKEKAKISDEISTALKTLFAVAENYPDLKANKNFLQLQERISGLENELADRREFYNDSVNNYNIRIQSIPDKFIARILGYKPIDLFKATEEEKKDVEIKF